MSEQDDMFAVVREAMIRSGRLDPGSADSQIDSLTSDATDTLKLITECVIEVINLPCQNIKQLADIRRTLRSVLKALLKEREHCTIGVIKRYVDPKCRIFVKSILICAVNVELVIQTSIEDTVWYQINHKHAEQIFAYLEQMA